MTLLSSSSKLRATTSWLRLILRWILRVFLVLLVLVAALIASLYFTALEAQQPVGFQAQQTTDGEGKPLLVGIWYPTTSPLANHWANSFFMKVAKNGEIKGRQLPLVVISHGTGGGITSHIDLALALASSGYVVAAPMHSDNYLDSSSVGSLQYIKGRNSQLTKTIDFMLNQWNGASSIDASKVGAYGFSIGGFTVLTSVGAKPNLKSVAKYCVEHREFVCDMLLDAKSFLLTPDLPVGIDAFSTDPRIKAAVLAAPGLGFTFTEQDGLKNVQIPIQIWQGNQDTLVPFATNSKLISENLPNKAELHLVANAAHTSFLAPCGILKLIPICSDPDQFDRQDFHQQMNSQVLEFYNRQLK